MLDCRLGGSVQREDGGISLCGWRWGLSMGGQVVLGLLFATWRANVTAASGRKMALR